MPTVVATAPSQTKTPAPKLKAEFVYTKPKSVSRDMMRFQFVFGGTPDDWKPGKNITGNLTVTYQIPYSPESFSLSELRKHVESEHDNNIRLAHRLGNAAKRDEHILIAKLSIESVRSWFRSQNTEAEDFMQAVAMAHLHNHTTNLDCLGLREPCRLSITPQHQDSLI